MENVMEFVQELGSETLKNIVSNLKDESAVSAGRTVVDWKLFDRIVINDGVASIDGSGNITAKTGTFQLPQLINFFNKTADGTLQGLMVSGNVARINNLVQDSKADEPYRFGRLAIDVEVMDCTPDGTDATKLAVAGGKSAVAIEVYKQILNGGKLIVNVNGRDLNYAEPIGFAGSSVAMQGENTNGVYNKKTPKLIDPAIYLPEGTTFNAKIAMVNPVVIPANVSVAITVSLLGYKFLKNC